MIYGVTLGGKHTYRDWGLLPKTRPTIAPPKVRTNYVDVPGLDGALDLSEALTGRVTMNAVESDRKTATISLKAVCDPYKLEITGSLDDWLWDTFNFETGIIRDYKALPVDGTLTLTIPGTRRPCIPTITASSAMTATFGGKEYALTAGDNRISGICITEGDNVLTFAGNGTVSIDYRGGRL